MDTMRSGRYSPSRRAQETRGRGKAWQYIERVHDYELYDPKERPDGVINLMGAENSLMADWMRSYVDRVSDPTEDHKSLSYGPTAGSEALRNAVAGFLNDQFEPEPKIESTQVLATNGVTSAIDLLIWSLCEPGDAVIYPVPTFYMLDFDLGVRNGVVSIPVAVEQDIKGDPFAPTEQAAAELESALERAIDGAAKRGVRCRVLFLCNPANPQGRCYSPFALERLARLCTRHGMHLVSDEIYALSNFSQDREPFCSVLSVPGSSMAKLQNVHCLYGMSKDFGLGGLRMGFMITRNNELWQALKKISFFTWITSGSDMFVTKLLRNLPETREFKAIFQKRLADAYASASKALTDHGIPFRPATSGLFIFIDLSAWLHYFPESTTASDSESQELQLWQWLLDRGVALNPGQFAESDKPGWYRLVFSGPMAPVVIAVTRSRRALDELEVTGNSGSAVCRHPSVPKSVGFASTDEKIVLAGRHKKPNRLQRARRMVFTFFCIQ